MNKLTNTATISRFERKASHRMINTMTTVTVPLRTAPSLMVANSSSAMATGPVSRTVA